MNKKQIMIVGGFVRDLLLGKTSKDMDFVVVGWTIEEFKKAFPEAQQIGRDFPVMLWDECEFAFARKERSTGNKHNDFEVQSDPSITIHEDLERRDLTINTFAMCPETGEIIGTKNAFSDLNNKILRHTSQAFSEDPLRVFRLARFSAKFPEFIIAEETIELCKTMKEDIKHLSKERVQNEMFLSFQYNKPSNFFKVLKEIDCLEFWFKEIYNCINVPAGPVKYHGHEDVFEHLMTTLDKCRKLTDVESTLFAMLCHDLGKQWTSKDGWPSHHGHDKEGEVFINSFCGRFNIQRNNRKAALLFCEQHMRIKKVNKMKPGKIVDLIIKINKNFPFGLIEFMKCAMCDDVSLTQNFIDNFIDFSKEIINVKLPREFWNLKEKSSEKLRELRINKLREIRREYGI